MVDYQNEHPASFVIKFCRLFYIFCRAKVVRVHYVAAKILSVWNRQFCVFYDDIKYFSVLKLPF